MPRHSYTIVENAVYGKPESIGSIMAKMAAAPTREMIECDAVSAYPKEMTSRRRSSSIPDTVKKTNRKRAQDESVVPYLISNRRTDDYLCGLLPRHSHPTPDWLIHPENYRCTKCHRYCSDSFLLNGLCGYCRGQY